MADGAHPNVSPASVSSQAAEGTCLVQSTSGQMHKSESSEELHQIESDTGEKKQEKISVAVSSIVNGQQQPFSETASKNNLSERLGLPLEEVRKSCQTEKGSCSQPTTLEHRHKGSVCAKLAEEHQPGFEQTDGVVSEDVCTELSEQHQSGCKHDPNEPLQSITAVSSSLISKNLDSSFVNVTVNSLIDELVLPQKDVSMSIQTGNTSCPQHVMSEQIYECNAGNMCIEASKQNHHLGSDLLQNDLEETSSPVPSCVVNEKLEHILENENSISGGQLELSSENMSKDCETGKSSCCQRTTSEQNFDSSSIYSELPIQKDQLISVKVQYFPVSTRTAVSNSILTEHLRPSPVPVRHLEPTLGDVNKGPNDKQLEPSSGDVNKKSSHEHFHTPPKSVMNNSSRLGRRDKRTAKSKKKKYMLRSLVGSDRVLRSRTREKPNALESSANLGNGNGAKRGRKRRNKRGKRIMDDEFSKIRKHLRYLLYRIGYEQNLIDAYSGEGWKGYSLEKLKPERELQRATSEILRRKLKIRDLFQRLDSLCAEGRFPNSLFDSEGQIDSEDIYCAKCESKDLSAGNDIILCDGACDRGFHQFCLEPPLLSEHIPPGDEGWLCPGCDCKFDCIDLLNDSQGTDLSISDSWEKVFPEAAAAAEGKNKDHNLELPSDESDDDDYDPDGPATDEKVQGDGSSSNESSSNESDYASASEELEAPTNNEQHLGLPSDDSEDDDYDPQAPDIEEGVKQESSSSDFTSDSEDLAVALGDNRSSENVGPMSPSSNSDPKKTARESDGQNRHVGKNTSLRKELLSIQDDSLPVSGKRRIERLDYKKLHDEEYGNVPSDSSDDEDFTDTAAPEKRQKSTGQVNSLSPSENASTTKNVKITEPISFDISEHAPKRRRGRKSKIENKNNSPSKSLEGSSKSASTSGKGRPSSHRRLGEAATERLYKSFKENQYPDRATKESLAQELGITSHQVSKWFENVRWSVRHSSSAAEGRSASNTGTASPQTNAIPKSEKQKNIQNSTQSGANNKKLPRTGDGQNSTIPNTRKRKGRSVNQASDIDSRIETPKPQAVLETPESGGRTKTRRRRKSVI
ncbi:homeobox protein HAT3.1 isoform X1 [Ziziphus jujuba]|uniref:Homeobox protein HAT3.1 isoform X1 n=1 Tax=Ziziphus jujuba TaxID=326968 RepID=A0ABM3IVW7_ZIZJJ|nr:homeobox protein HAT3.1 isoform X1 [Ziziphus jujuba]XP_048336227.2 homeobox protein HAT3.1 isoform X1 [Ziziphus jujuba]XP_060676207.1 homeobox protein HAT3.1 isoform X1 [Ziziphus jujuba]